MSSSKHIIIRTALLLLVLALFAGPAFAGAQTGSLTVGLHERSALGEGLPGSDFTATVRLTTREGEPLQTPISYSGAAEGVTEAGRASFKIKHGQEVTFSEIPIDTNYSVRYTDWYSYMMRTYEGTADGTITGDNPDQRYAGDFFLLARSASFTPVVNTVVAAQTSKNPIFRYQIKRVSGPEKGYSVNPSIKGGYKNQRFNFTPITFSSTGDYVFEISQIDDANVDFLRDEVPVRLEIKVGIRTTGEKESQLNELYIESYSYTKNGEPHQNAEFVQKYVPKSNLEITCQTQGESADRDNEFSYRIELTAGEIPLPERLALTHKKADGQTEAKEFSSGETVTLKHGESAAVIGLPKGTTYKVVQDPEEGWTTNVGGESGTMPADGTVYVNYVHLKEEDASEDGYGHLTVSAATTGLDPGENPDFPVTVHFYRPNLSFQVRGLHGKSTIRSGETVTLKNGESFVVQNIPAGTSEGWYSVSPVVPEGYTVDQQRIDGTMTDEGQQVIFNFKKKDPYAATGNLTVEKKLENSSETGKEFQFDVNFSGDGSDGVFLTDRPGLTVSTGTRFTLKGGQKLTIRDIPENVVYQVLEAGEPEYITTKTGDSGIIGAGDDNAVFTNRRGAEETADLTVTKKVENKGDSDDTFTFTFGLTGPFSGDTYTITGDAGSIGQIRTGGKFTLKDGGTAVIHDLPAGISYSVSEEANENYLTENPLKAGTITGSAGETAAFVNTRERKAPENGILEIEKSVSGASTERDFDITVGLKDAGGEPLEGSYKVEGTEETQEIADGGKLHLHHGEQARITVPDGTQYTVSEDEYPGYDQNIAPASGTVDSLSTNRVTVSNAYSLTAAQLAPTVRNEIASSVLGFAPETDEEFRFTITPSGSNPDGASLKTSETVSRTGAGDAGFSPVTFTKTGTFNFTIIEQTGSGNYDYDRSVWNLKVEVTDDDMGHLVVSPLYHTESETPDSGSYATFTNTWRVQEPSTVISGQVTTTSEIQAGDKGSEPLAYTFTLTGDADGSDFSGEESASKSYSARRTAFGKTDSFSFPEITYEKPGTYTYTLKQDTEGPAALGIEADSREVTATVKVDATGHADVSYGPEPLFSNTDGAALFEASARNILTADGDIKDYNTENIRFTYKLEGTGGTRAGEYTLEAPYWKEGDPKTYPDKDETDEAQNTHTGGSFYIYKPGACSYTLTQEIFRSSGITADSEKASYSFTATSESGKINLGEVSADKGGAFTWTEPATFTNTYEPSAAVFQLRFKKESVGTLDEHQFTFTAEPGSENARAEGMTPKAVTAGEGEHTFSAIRYTKPGEYAYVIKETPGASENITYDTREYAAFVEVRDAGGHLSAECRYGLDKASAGQDTVEMPVFVNTQKEEGKHALTFTKRVSTGGLIEGEKFSFTLSLTEADGKYGYTTTGGESGQIGSGESFELAANESIVINGLPEGAGYTFTEIPHRFYESLSPVTGTINAGDDENAADATNRVKAHGQLKIENPQLDAFGSAHKAWHVKVELSGTDIGGDFPFEKSGSKENVSFPYEFDLDPQESALFTFLPAGATANITFSQDGGAGTAATVQIEDQMVKTQQTPTEALPTAELTIKNETSGEGYNPKREFTYHLSMSYPSGQPVTFKTGGIGEDGSFRLTPGGQLKVSAPQGCSYTITQDTFPNYTAGRTEASGKIREDGQEEVFTNTFTGGPAEAVAKAAKTVTGNPGSAERFTFDLHPESMTGAGRYETITAACDGQGEAVFEPLTFAYEGDYVFTLDERPTGKNAWTDDTAEWTWTVSVTRDPDTDLLAASGSYKKNGTAEQSAEAASFTNEYHAAQTSASPEVTVRTESSVSQPDIASSAFTFSLKGPEGGGYAVSQETARVTGERWSADQKIDFGEVTFFKEGSYRFTISQTTPDFKGLAADREDIFWTVNVTDRNGQLRAEDSVSREGFANTYTPAATSFTPELLKTVSGEADEVYRFTLSRKTGAFGQPEEIADSGAGMISFSPIEIATDGTATFTISEQDGGDENIIYDTESWTLTLTAADQDGQLTATPVYARGGQENSERAQINNTVKEPGKGTISFTKEVSGIGPAEDFRFHFTLDNGESYQTTLPDGSEGTIRTGETFTLKAGQTIVIKNLPEGASYRFTEDESLFYEQTDTEIAGTVREGARALTFHNKARRTGALTVKNPESDTRGFPHSAREAAITLKDPDGEDLPGQYPAEGAGSATVGSGSKVRLEPGTQLKITGLPENASYSIDFGYAEPVSGNLPKMADEYATAPDEPLESLPQGSVTVAKTVAGGSSESFDFILRLTWPSGTVASDLLEGGQSRISVKAGESETIGQIPIGCGYTVSEVSSEGYDVTSTGSQGTVESASRAEFTNTPQIAPGETGSLRVEKIATGFDDPDREFTFTLHLEGAPDGATWPIYFNEADEPGASVANDGTFSLKGGERAVIENLPRSAIYMVSEAKSDDYTTTSQRATGQIYRGVMSTAVFENTKTDPHPELKTGSLRLVSRTSGAPYAADFNFKVTFDDGGTYSGVISGRNFTLSGDAEKLMTGIPAGTHYTVAMTPRSDYETSATGQEGVIAGGGTAEAVFTNTYKGSQEPEPETGSLRISCVNDGGNASHSFSYTATVVQDGQSRAESFELTGGQSRTIEGLDAGSAYSVSQTQRAGYGYKAADATGSIRSGETAEAVFTNTWEGGQTPEPEEGALTVSNTADGAERFSYHVTFTPDPGNAGADFTLAGGESRTFGNLPAGTAWTATQEIREGYDVNQESFSGTITAGNTDRADFVNTRQSTEPEPERTGTLKVVSRVSGTDRADTFSYTVSYIPDFAGSVKNFTLAAGQERSFEVPNGTAYTVSQAQAQGYTTASTGATGTVRAGQTSTAAFTSTWTGAEAETADITVRTASDGSVPAGTAFTFTFGLTGGSGSWRLEGADAESVAPGGKFTLPADGQALIKDVPAGAVYSLTAEAPEGFEIHPAQRSGILGAQGADLAFETSSSAAPEAAGLTVSKSVTGRTQESAFEIRARVAGTGNETYQTSRGPVTASGDVFTLRLSDGESVTISGLPDSAYSVEEMPYEGCTPSIDNQAGTLRAGVNTQVRVANRFGGADEGHSLTVTNPGPEEKDVQVRFKDKDGNPAGPFPSTAGELSDGSEFRLGPGESLTIEDMPAETAAEFYTGGRPAGSATAGKDGSVTLSGPAESTGTLRVSNTVTGEEADLSKAFSYTLTLEDGSGNALTGDFPAAGIPARTVRSGDKFTLASGEVAEITLPAGTAYKAVQAQEADYTTASSGAEGVIAAGASCHADFVNTHIHEYPEGDPGLYSGILDISNSVIGGPEGASFTFTLTLPGEGPYSGFHSDGTVVNVKTGDTITLKDGESFRITALPYGGAYKVEESVPEGYSMRALASEGQLGSEPVHAVFTNTWTADDEKPAEGTADLSVSKSVTGEGAPDETFAFTAVLKDADGAELTGEYPYAGSREGTVKSGGTLELSARQRVIIRGLPDKARYEISERPASEGFTPEAIGASGELEAGKTATAAFVNRYESEGAGTLKITKKVEGVRTERKFSFRVFVYLATADVDEDFKVTGDWEGTIKTGGTIYLGDGEEATVSGIPAGTAFVVSEEEAEGFDTSFTGNSAVVKAGGEYTAAFTNTAKKTDPGTDPDDPDSPGGEEGTASLTVSKTVKAGGYEALFKDTDFTFTLTATLDGEPVSKGIQINGEDYASGEGFTLRDGQSASFTGIPAGAEFSLEESPADGFTSESEGASGTAEAGKEYTAAFTNTWKSSDAGVPGGDGQPGDTEKPSGGVSDTDTGGQSGTQSGGQSGTQSGAQTGQDAGAGTASGSQTGVQTGSGSSVQGGSAAGTSAAGSSSASAGKTASGTTSSTGKTASESPKTGGDRNILLWAGLSAIGALGVLAAWRRRKA